jgi:outer membrane protein assembly factor BamB
MSMPSSTRRRLLPVALAWTALACTSLAWAVSGPGTALAGDCLSGTLADEFTADRVGLVREWIIQIPSLAPGRSLENVVAGDGLVVAATSDGLVHAIQAAPSQAIPQAVPQTVPQPGTPLPGSLLWSRPVGRPGGRLEQAGIGADLIAVCQDKDIYGLARATGLQRWQETDKNLAAAGAAVVGDWVYAPNGNGITRFAVNPLRQPADAPGAAAPDASRQAGASSTAAKTPAKKAKKAKKREESLLPADIESGGVVAYQPVPLHEGVLWCTTDGLLVTLQPTEVDWRRLEFALENPPAGPPTVRDRSIFAATTNGDLARIDLPAKLTKLAQLQLAWHTVLPCPAESSGFVNGDTVVVSLGDLGIAAYSAETGAFLWQSCVAGTIVSVGGDRVWLFDRVGRLSSLHIADGLRRETLCLGPFTMPLANLRDDRLLLASPSGMIVSLAPRRAASAAEAPADGEARRPDSSEEAGADAPAETDAEPMPAAEPMEEPAEEMPSTDTST